MKLAKFMLKLNSLLSLPLSWNYMEKIAYLVADLSFTVLVCLLGSKNLI